MVADQGPKEQRARLGGFIAKENRDEFAKLLPTTTLEKPRLSFDLDSAERGEKDFAELRTDRTGTYYSNFTPQGESPMSCLPDSLRFLGAMFLFFKCAVKSLILTTEAISMALLGCGAVLLCSENVLDFRFSMEKSAVFVGLVFPLVFLIGQTWGRREQASAAFTAIRGNGIHMVLKLLAANQLEKAREANQRIRELCDEIHDYLPQDSYGSLMRIANIYGMLTSLDAIGDAAQVRFMTVEFEKLKQLRNYRTPWKLNYFVFFFGSLAPIGFAPMFATVGCLDRGPERMTPDDGAGCGYGTFGAYASMIFFSLLLAALLGVVKSLEDCFSLDGFDDVVCQFAIEGRALDKVISDRASSLSGVAGAVAENSAHQQRGRTAAEEHGGDDDAVADALVGI